MLTLYHHPFSPASRFVRLILAEYGVNFELVEERPWERRQEFMILNPSGQVPVAVENDGPPICGASVIMEYIDETRGFSVPDKRLMPDNPETRAEMRRLVEWFLDKFDAEVGGYLVREKIYKQLMPKDAGGGAPDSAALRAARANIKHHLRYIGYLAGNRNWLAGTTQTFGDFAAAAQLSCADYLGEVPWQEDAHAKAWYARVKSRPSFRALLTERVLGMPASSTYADLDF